MATAGGGGNFNLSPAQSTSVAGKIAYYIIYFYESKEPF
jgi:hypothetical protein